MVLLIYNLYIRFLYLGFQIKTGESMEKKLVGMVVHFYPKVSVAVVDVTDTLRVGDKITMERGTEIVEQVVAEMQIEHKKIQEAKKGQSIGLKVFGKTKEGARVFKVID